MTWPYLEEVYRVGDIRVLPQVEGQQPSRGARIHEPVERAVSRVEPHLNFRVVSIKRGWTE